ncbi:HigA family addiction module antitoxin [Marinoscillum sp.]|uniref:HigA family addiction module antitoxin n=1 Tax=Marinoscillum sp. TaxID=2024838 RepID=UPI003BAC5675
MIATHKIRPARRFGPGYFIREQLDYRQWSQEELADITGFSQKHISEVLSDKKPVTLDMARILSEVFDTSAQYWLNLDSSYRLWLQAEPSEKEKDADIKSQIYERMPVRDMVKKGWLPKPNNVKDLVAGVCAFWETKELDFTELEASQLCLTRKSEAYNQFNASYASTWYKKARTESNKIKVEKYDKQALEKLVVDLYLFTEEIEGIAAFLTELQRVGVKAMILPHLEKTYLDGAAFFDGNNPVVVYTGRYKRIDNFWFTVAHELAHVLYHINEVTPFVLDNLKDGDRNEMENEANEMAGKWLRHDELLEAVTPYLHRLTSVQVEAIASNLQIHPSIIVGKLAHDQKISARHIHLYNKQNVLDLIPSDYKISG